MTILVRSRVLLLGSIPFPTTVAFFRLASLEQRRAVATHARVLLVDFTGLVPDIFIDLGILCLFGFVVSTLVDYFHRGRSDSIPNA
jgi:hypothetical protein